MKIGIYGATGYGGMQLASMLVNHPEIEIEFISSNRFSGQKFSQLYSKFCGILDMELISSEESYDLLSEVELVFLALPHGVSMEYVVKLRELNPSLKIVDFSGDFRISDSSVYNAWYGFEHIAEELIPSFVYGLPEIYREEIKTAQYVANPGCFPTSMILGLYPLVKENLIEKKVISDSKTGVSGAGRKDSHKFLFTEIQDSTYGYNTGKHRHSPEVEDIIQRSTDSEIKMLFSPHIVPSSRGILSTMYMTLKEGVTEADVNAAFEKYYADEPFIELVDHAPSTKDVNRSNRVFINSQYDPLSETLVVFSTIDNLMKGASSQAIQNMNIMCGFEEKTGIGTDQFYL
jgi:N-acetyl-gamma-glutamyl-phosphate reductase